MCNIYHISFSCLLSAEQTTTEPMTTVVTPSGGTEGGNPGLPPGTYDCVTADPCADPDGTEQYFTHPDNTKYIHCAAGNICNVQVCAGGLVWNPSIQACDWP